MDTRKIQAATSVCHIVAMPYPGRGHINPMMNLCKLIASRKDDILITFVVTEEWLGFISSDFHHYNSISPVTIPNVIPSELGRGSDFLGFFEAVMTKMEAPFEQILDQLQLPVTTIITDAILSWTIRCGSSRNIPVAALWTASASVFSMNYHFHLFTEERFPVGLMGDGNTVDFIPGISSMSVADIPRIFFELNKKFQRQLMEMRSWMSKVQCLVFSSIYELETQVIDVLKAKFDFPIYSVGPLIPYFELKSKTSSASDHQDFDYIKWLDMQPASSVLYNHPNK